MNIDFSKGAWTLGRFRGAPIRLHWSILFLFLFFGGSSVGGWLGIALVVLVHELGHAWVVHAMGGRCTEIVVHGMGGHCSHTGVCTSRGHVYVAWGGVLGQLVLGLFAVFVLSSALPIQADRDVYGFYYALTGSSLRLALFNLIPIKPLDGYDAWRLPGILRDDFQRWNHWRRHHKDIAASRSKRSAPPKPRGGPSDSGRITDRETSDRLFDKMYTGLLTRLPEPDPEEKDERSKSSGP